MIPTLGLFGMLACAVLGAAAGILVWWVSAALRTEDLRQDQEWRYDVNRINSLRRHDPVYRLFQPVLQFLAKLNQAAFAESLPEVSRRIHAAGLPRFWLPEESL